MNRLIGYLHKSQAWKSTGDDNHLFTGISMWAWSKIEQYSALLNRRSIPLLLGWPALITVILTLLNWYESRNSVDDPTLTHAIAYSAPHAFIVSWFVFVAYAIFDLCRIVILNLKKHTNPVVHFFVAVPPILLGIRVGDTVTAFLLNQPVRPTVDSGISMALGILGGLVFIFFFSYRSQRQEADQLRVATAEAELRVLRDQMRPHFLFNSLNSLAELIESDAHLAANMTQKLSDLYRLILTNSKKKMCSLESEMAVVQAYLELEKLRFDERLIFSFESSVNLSEIFVPSLVMQTLAENAVKHGISNAEDGGRIDIFVSKNAEGWTEITIKNSGAPLKNGDSDAGTGLANTRKRLDLLYGKNHGFCIKSDSDGLTEVKFKVSGARFG